MTGFGSELKREREARNVTLEALAAETRVKREHLQALEEERYRELPGGVFRRGIAQSYISALTLEDGAAWMARFQQSLKEVAGENGEAGADEQWAAFAENVKRNRSPTAGRQGVRWAGVLALLVAVLAAAWAFWRFMLQGRMHG